MSWLKRFIYLSITLVLLVAGLMYFFLDQAYYKSLLVTQVKKKIHREVSIVGKIDLSFLPEIKLTIHQPLIFNSPAFPEKIFAQAESISFGVKLLPLLQGKIEASEIQIKDLKLNLYRSKTGAVNWDKFMDGRDGGLNPSLFIPGIDLSNAEISLRDEQNIKQIKLSHLALNRKASLLTRSKPLHLSFNYLIDSYSGNASLSADSKVEPFKGNILFDQLKIKTSLNAKELHYQLKATTKGTFNYRQQFISLEKISGDISKLKFSGNLSIMDLQRHPYLRGQFIIKPMNLKEWLESTGFSLPQLSSANDLSGELKIDHENINGDFLLKEGILSNLKLQQIQAHFYGSTQGLTIQPIRAELYKGQMQARSKITLDKELPQLEFQAEIKDLDAKQLLSDIAGKSKIQYSGKGELNIRLFALGKTGPELLSKLNGSGNINFKNGEITGIDIIHYIFSGYSLLLDQRLAEINLDKKQIGDLSASFEIYQGLVSNHDLLLTMTDYTVKGNGSFDLSDNKIKYQLIAKMKHNNTDISRLLASLINNENDRPTIYDVEVPILINGKLDDPQVNLGTITMLKDIVFHQVAKGIVNYLAH